MKLETFIAMNFNKRKECAKAMGISYEQINNMLSSGCEVVELKNGDWVTLHKKHKRVSPSDFTRFPEDLVK